LGYTSTESTPVGEEAFACVSCPRELVVFFFETRQRAVAVLIVGPMYVMGEL